MTLHILHRVGGGERTALSKSDRLSLILIAVIGSGLLGLIAGGL